MTEEIPGKQILEKALALFKEDYPNAQQAFIQLEVFEYLRSRELIRKLGHAFELFAAAVEKDDPRKLDDLQALLHAFTLECLLYVCDMRLREINTIARWRKRLWLLFLRDPFKDDVQQLWDCAQRRYLAGTNESTPLSHRFMNLKKCFQNLERLLAIIQSHRVYDHLFTLAVHCCFLVAGVVVGILHLRS